MFQELRLEKEREGKGGLRWNQSGWKPPDQTGQALLVQVSRPRWRIALKAKLRNWIGVSFFFFFFFSTIRIFIYIGTELFCLLFVKCNQSLFVYISNYDPTFLAIKDTYKLRSFSLRKTANGVHAQNKFLGLLQGKQFLRTTGRKSRKS